MVVYLEKYRDEKPTIGHVVSEDGENIEVELWTGRYSTTWRVCKRRVGRQSIPWNETIASSTILHQVQFTKSNKLKQKTVKQLAKL